MASDENQRRVFEFLVQRFWDQEPFEKADLRPLTDWSETSLDTYLSKQLRPFFVSVSGSRKMRVGESFRRFLSWEKFQQHVTQVRRASDYAAHVHESIIVFEFFMPLTNEEHLRTSLDALFYKDEVIRRLKTVDREKVAVYFPRSEGSSDDTYLEGVAQWIGAHFGGYSISHVDGRFRAGPIASLSSAIESQRKGLRYLVDETTAIVRFIFPCGKPVKRDPLADTFEDDVAIHDPDADTLAEARKIRWAFGVLFVQSVIQVVNGEAEIWMVEGGLRNRLHVWRPEGND